MKFHFIALTLHKETVLHQYLHNPLVVCVFSVKPQNSHDTTQKKASNSQLSNDPPTNTIFAFSFRLNFV